jgi:DNA-binding NarL/FixJ family response regulator
MAQSAPHLAVAHNHDLDVPPSRPVPRAVGSGAPRAIDHWPARSLEEAAIRADASSASEAQLGPFWQYVMDGHLVICGSTSTAERRYVIAHRARDAGCRPRPLGRIETAVLVRVLCGDQQKLVAADLGIACSTASKWYTEAVKKLHLESSPVPLPLVLAAQSWASGRALDVDARYTEFEYEGSEFLSLSASLPDGRSSQLTLAELEVAKLVIDGASRWHIAAHRSTSAQTVACQLRGVYSKFKLSGRFALIRYVEEAGWFR